MAFFSRLRAERAATRELGEGVWRRAHDRFQRSLDRVFQVVEGITDVQAYNELIKEANEIVGDIADKQVLDAAIVAAAQAVEHYEITRYGTLATWAKQLGREDCAELLVETLEEEKEADEILTDVAKGRVNAEAA